MAAVWLFLAAIPVFADGGPHQMKYNNGSAGLNADSCAGCHRIHSATSSAGGYLLGNNASTISQTTYTDVNDYCLSCHSSTGFGATTDVETGLQYYLANGAQPSAETTSGTALGALRGGGFVDARIGSDAAYRIRTVYDTTKGLDFIAKVPVRADATTATSAHLKVGTSTINPTNIAWGNGASGAGPLFSGGLECTSCHNPHGNGQYRILNPIPTDGSTGNLTEATTPAGVYDSPLPVSGDTRNYTVIQIPGTIGTNSSYLLYASQVNGHYSASSGDYVHRVVPWTNPSGAFDAPNGRPYRSPAGIGSLVDGFDKQMTTWCVTCHTRYYSETDPAFPNGDPPYQYQHMTTNNLACTTCHVAHGSNARMDGTGGTTYSSDVVYPDGTTHRVGDSRLLKVDNRGTCQLCHDPTNTVLVGQSNGPTPNPLVP